MGKPNRQSSLAAIHIFVFGLMTWFSQPAYAQGPVLALPSEDQEVITRQLGPIVQSALPSEPIEDVSVYFPLRERSATYHVTGGRHIGSQQTLGVSQIALPDGKSTWRFEMSPSLSAFISESPDGDLMMPSLSDVKQGIVVVTSPANPFVLKGMQPGETRTYAQHVAVYALEEPSDEEYSGSLNGAYTYIGTYQIAVPAGTFQTVLLRLKSHGKIGPVHTHDSAYYFLAPGKGMVAMISQEDAVAFWIFHIDSTAGRVLAAD